MPHRLRGLGKDPFLSRVSARLAQRVRPLDGSAASASLELLDPPVEVCQAAGVRGHARLDDVGQALELRQGVQLGGMFGMGEDLP